MRTHVGRILGQALGLLRRDLLPYAVLGVLLFAPVFAASLIVGQGEPTHWAQPEGVAPGEAGGQSLLAGQAVVGMLAFLAYYLLAGALAPGALARLGGHPLPARRIVKDGIQGLLPALDDGFVTGVLVGAGFVLLVVPGLLLAALTYVALPAGVTERLDVVGAIRRSRDLTRGRRGALLLVFLVTVGLMVAAGVVVPVLAAGLGRTGAILLGAIAQVAFGLFGAACQTVAYADLRTEG